MHPVTRVAGLVALAIGLASAAVASLAFATALLMVLAVITGEHRAVFLDPPRRLKWLLASVLALYAFMIPGEPVLANWPAVSPTTQGAVQGLLRCWMLVLMAGSARLLMTTTPREAVMGALYWTARPFERLGVDSARFCLRLVLTLEYALVFRRRQSSRGVKPRGGFTERAAALARSRLRDAGAAAGDARTGPVTIPLCGAPPPWQWSLPAALLVALLGLANLV